MKKLNSLTICGILFLSLALVFSGCKKSSDSTPAPTTGAITGTATFPAGTSGDLSNAKVSLYASYNDWVNNVPLKYSAVGGSGASASFGMSNIVPGVYYLDIWKDIDNSAGWSSGDFVGWYGSGGLGAPSLTPVQITAGGTVNCPITMYIIAK